MEPYESGEVRLAVSASTTDTELSVLLGHDQRILACSLVGDPACVG